MRRDAEHQRASVDQPSVDQPSVRSVFFPLMERQVISEEPGGSCRQSDGPGKTTLAPRPHRTGTAPEETSV